MIKDDGQPPVVGKNVDADPRHPLRSVWMVHDGVCHDFTVQEARQLAIDLYAVTSGHQPTDPFDTAKLEPLTAEEAERVDEILAVSPSPWEPTAAERALAISLYAERMRVDGTPQTWEQALFNYAGNVTRQQNVPASINACVSYGLNSGFFVDHGYDADAIRARMAADLEIAQEIAREDWQAEND